MTDSQRTDPGNTPQADAAAPAAKPGRRRLAILVIASLAVVLALAVAVAGIHWRLWRPPYGGVGKALAAVSGELPAAYNAEEVVPGRVWRSGRPDERWYRYLHDRGVRRVVRLCGPTPKIPGPPDELGWDVRTYSWSSSRPPKVQDLREVLDLLDANTPVLIHCSAGADRTGYAIAAYRIFHQGWHWSVAFEEMNEFWHFPDDTPQLQENLLKVIRTRAIETRVAASADTAGEPAVARTEPRAGGRGDELARAIESRPARPQPATKPATQPAEDTERPYVIPEAFR